MFKIEPTQLGVLRTLLKLPKNSNIRNRLNVNNIVEYLKAHQNNWLAHLKRMDMNGLPKLAIHKPTQVKGGTQGDLDHGSSSRGHIYELRICYKNYTIIQTIRLKTYVSLPCAVREPVANTLWSSATKSLETHDLGEAGTFDNTLRCKETDATTYKISTFTMMIMIIFVDKNSSVGTETR